MVTCVTYVVKLDPARAIKREFCAGGCAVNMCVHVHVVKCVKFCVLLPLSGVQILSRMA